MNGGSPTAEPSFAPAPFGRYTLLQKLATGGMGEIFLARLPGVEGLARLVVIKRIREELASDRQFVDRFISEARVLLHLQHGSIAQVLEVGEVAGKFFIALELVDGKDLRALLGRLEAQGKRLPPGLALYVILRVLDALAYAHRKKDEEDRELNLVHRDVSPPNVLISYEGDVKVIDFGLAKSELSIQRTRPNVLMGKFLYLAPEIARHDRLDKRADLFSAGVVLHEMLAGKHPYASLGVGEIMQRAAKPAYPPLAGKVPGVTPQLDAAIQKALSADPEQRYRTADEMRAALAPFQLALDPGASSDTLGTLVRGAFDGEYGRERRLYRALRAGEPVPVDGESDTARSASLKDVQKVAAAAPRKTGEVRAASTDAPTALFTPLPSDETPAPAIPATYVGTAPPRPDVTEPGRPALEVPEAAPPPRARGRSATAGELPAQALPFASPRLELPRAEPVVAPTPDETSPGETPAASTTDRSAFASTTPGMAPLEVTERPKPRAASRPAQPKPPGRKATGSELPAQLEARTTPVLETATPRRRTGLEVPAASQPAKPAPPAEPVGRTPPTAPASAPGPVQGANLNMVLLGVTLGVLVMGLVAWLLLR